jgi:predicted nucleotidyltransferase
MSWTKIRDKGSHDEQHLRHSMRLTPDQIQAIKQTAETVLGDDARVILFGSRVDDTKKGGDIDLLFETDHRVGDHVATVGALYVALIRKLGDRKIDILLRDAATPTAPVLTIARQTGVQL